MMDRERRLAAEYAATRDRLLGYEDGLAAAGIAIDDVPIVESFNDRRSAAEGAATLFDMAPEMTAVLAMSDVLALAALDEARRRGLDVPKNLSVVGFDDVPEAAASAPPLTTIAQPIVEKGRLAAQMIFDGGAPRKELLRVSLVQRASTAPPMLRAP
jgi:DNA-binding LacI/PurR family transcriptional regulator